MWRPILFVHRAARSRWDSEFSAGLRSLTDPSPLPEAENWKALPWNQFGKKALIRAIV